jgi:hypothetical protein
MKSAPIIDLISAMHLRQRLFYSNLLEAVCYGFSKSFWKIYFRIKAAYLLRGPFDISRAYYMLKGLSAEPYGETPLKTFEQIAKAAAIDVNSFVYELGAGRGLGSFWLNHFCKCQVMAIDQIPLFAQIAQHVIQKNNLSKIEFRNENFLYIDYGKATHVYLYGTCLSDASIHALIKAFETLKKGVKIISVSYPLTDYDTTGLFELQKTLSLDFVWGRAEVFIQEKR